MINKIKSMNHFNKLLKMILIKDTKASQLPILQENRNIKVQMINTDNQQLKMYNKAQTIILLKFNIVIKIYLFK